MSRHGVVNTSAGPLVADRFLHQKLTGLDTGRAIDEAMPSLYAGLKALMYTGSITKLCLIDRSRRVRIKNTAGHPNRFTGCREIQL